MNTAYWGIIIACVFLPAIIVAIFSIIRMDRELTMLRAQNAELGGALSAIINCHPDRNASSLKMLAKFGIDAANNV